MRHEAKLARRLIAENRKGKTMTFDEWWDTTKTESTPDTYNGWENSCRQAWAVAALAEQRRWEEALRKTWQMVDPLNPAGSPGSYARGQDSGIVAALNTLRENLGA